MQSLALLCAQSVGKLGYAHEFSVIKVSFTDQHFNFVTQRPQGRIYDRGCLHDVVILRSVAFAALVTMAIFASRLHCQRTSCPTSSLARTRRHSLESMGKYLRRTHFVG
jgi:hypothetical protein